MQCVVGFVSYVRLHMERTNCRCDPHTLSVHSACAGLHLPTTDTNTHTRKTDLEQPLDLLLIVRGQRLHDERHGPDVGRADVRAADAGGYMCTKYVGVRPAV